MCDEHNVKFVLEVDTINFEFFRFQVVKTYDYVNFLGLWRHKKVVLHESCKLSAFHDYEYVGDERKPGAFAELIEKQMNELIDYHEQKHIKRSKDSD